MTPPTTGRAGRAGSYSGGAVTDPPTRLNRASTARRARRAAASRRGRPSGRFRTAAPRAAAAAAAPPPPHRLERAGARRRGAGLRRPGVLDPGQQDRHQGRLRRRHGLVHLGPVRHLPRRPRAARRPGPLRPGPIGGQPRGVRLGRAGHRPGVDGGVAAYLWLVDPKRRPRCCGTGTRWLGFVVFALVVHGLGVLAHRRRALHDHAAVEPGAGPHRAWWRWPRSPCCPSSRPPTTGRC